MDAPKQPNETNKPQPSFKPEAGAMADDPPTVSMTKSDTAPPAATNGASGNGAAQAAAPNGDTQRLVQDILNSCAEKAKCGKSAVLESIGKVKKDDIDLLTKAIETQLDRVKNGDTSGISIFEKDGVNEASVTQFVTVADKAKAELTKLYDIAQKVQAAEGDLAKLDSITFEELGGFRNEAFGVLTAMDIYLSIPVYESTTVGDHVAIASAAKHLNDAGRLNEDAADYYDREERDRLLKESGLARGSSSIH